MKYDIKRLITFGLIVMVLFGFSAGAFAAPAGTEIKNQATATYRDQNGVEQETASNEVITQVKQVYGIDIAPSGDPALQQEAAPGNTVYYSYTLTNTGNGDDTYELKAVNQTGDDFDPNNIAIYLDENGNGLVDSGESLLNDTDDDYTAANDTPTLAADEQVKLVMKYTVPSSQGDGDVTQVDIQGRSVGDNNKTDTENINETTVREDAVVTASKSVSPDEVDPGGTLTYEISGSNTGNRAAKGQAFTSSTSNVLDFDDDGSGEQHEGILITDDVPDSTSYTNVTASGTPVSSVPVYYDSNDSTWKDAEGDVDGTITKVGLFIPDVNSTNGNQEDVLDPGQGYSFTFEVTVDSDAPAGIVSNVATVNWADSDDTNKTTETNDADAMVNPEYEVFIGPDGSPEASGPNDQNDDTTDAGTQAAGTWVSFTNTVKNAGNSSDTINVNVKSKPAIDWQVQLYKSDGITPLADTNGDGTPDVGELASGGTSDLVVKVLIPSDEATDNDGDSTVHDTVIEAVSAGNDSKTNETIDRVTDIVSAGVDIANNDNGYDNTTITNEADPGTCTQFPLMIVNTGGSPDTFDLSVSSTLSDGWTNTFYPDSNLDETPDSMTDPITSVGPLGGAVLTSDVDNSDTLPVSSTDYFTSGDTVRINDTNYTVNSVDTAAGEITINDSISQDKGTEVGEVQGAIAKVCVPAGASPGDTNVDFTATSNQDPDQSDTITDTVSVKNAPDVSLSPDRSGTGAPGGTSVYQHELCNTGNVDDTFELSYTSDWSWQYTFTDANGDPIDDSDGDGTPDISVNSGSCVTINVTANIPSDASIDQVDSATITATGESHNATDTAQDTTRVVQGKLELDKSVSPEGEQEPGTTLIYTTTYKNLGNAAITSVAIYDAIPSYTTYQSDTASGTLPDSASTDAQILYDYSTDGGSSWNGWSTSSPKASGITNLKWGLDMDGDNDVDEDDSLSSGASGQVSFEVTINQD